MKSENKIILRDNHRRSLKSTLMIVERLLIEIQDLMVNQYKSCCFEIKNDIDDDIIYQNLKVIEEARKQICNLTEKYNTDKSIQSLQMIVNVKKTKIWEILCDSTSKKLKGFGEFPQNQAIEYDEDINNLISITNRVNY
jgi:hypothetical protein